MKIEPPPLIDELLAKADMFRATQVEIGGRWYCARGLPYYHWRKVVRQAQHAWLVLVGRAMAFQFAEDRTPNMELTGGAPTTDTERPA